MGRYIPAQLLQEKDANNVFGQTRYFLMGPHDGKKVDILSSRVAPRMTS